MFMCDPRRSVLFLEETENEKNQSSLSSLEVTCSVFICNIKIRSDVMVVNLEDGARRFRALSLRNIRSKYLV